MTVLVLLLVLAVLLLGTAVLFNQLARLRNACANALAQIDVQLKRRHDLVPNLVEVARKYLEHERATLEGVMAARHAAVQAQDQLRAQPTDAGSAAALMQAEGRLRTGLGRLLAVAESYPDLKADQTLRELSEELTHTENRIGFARQAYNDAVLDYNNAVAQFPGNLVAHGFGFALRPMLESTTSEAERAPVRVSF